MNIIVWNNGVANPWGSQSSSGIQNNLRKRDVDLDDILDAINKCCELILQSIANSVSVSLANQEIMKRTLVCGETHIARFDSVLSAILDLRRELLRGNRDIRR